MRNTDSSRRPYESPLRAEQREATRARLVDAVLEQVRAGAADVSMVQIARDASVSLPTVYRHFPTRTSLMEAVFERVNARAPFLVLPADVRAALPAFFRWREEVAKELGPMAAHSPLVWEFRRGQTVPRRRGAMERLVAERAPGLAEPERTWLVDLLVVLVSDMMATALRGYLDLDADAAGERAVWAFDALLSYGRTSARRGKSHEAERAGKRKGKADAKPRGKAKPKGKANVEAKATSGGKPKGKVGAKVGRSPARARVPARVTARRLGGGSSER